MTDLFTGRSANISYRTLVCVYIMLATLSHRKLHALPTLADGTLAPSRTHHS